MAGLKACATGLRTGLRDGRPSWQA